MTSEFDDPQTYEIIGAAMEVHRALSDGFVEPIYREALTLELLRRDIPFAREVGAASRSITRGISCPCGIELTLSAMTRS